MLYSRLRCFFSFLIKTPFHPQWLACGNGFFEILGMVWKLRKGRLLDVGCSDKKLKKHIPEDIKYLGLDYYNTATYLYDSRPDCYGDAQALPFSDATFDIVIVKDVIEHIPDPSLAFTEISRVLKKGGVLLLTVPFLYPSHDAPYDYQRFTIYGLRYAADRYGFSIQKETKIGSPMETAALLSNIAAVRVTLETLRSYNPIGLLLLVMLPPFVFFFNLIGWMLGKVSTNDDMMPFSFSLLMVKNS